MDHDEKFWVSIWSLVAIVLIAAMFFGTLSSHLQRKELSEMVKNGADPMSVSCAFGVGQNDVSICTLLANKEKK